MATPAERRVRIFSSDVVVPVTSAPIEGASVATRDGRILDVGDRSHLLRSYPGAEEFRWEGVLIPGLVNAHTHLQYTRFAELGATPHASFEEWSIAFDLLYDPRSKTEDWRAAALEGAEMALSSGTTTVADICTDLPAIGVLRDSGLSGYSFLEVMGYAWDDWKGEGRDHILSQLASARIIESPARHVGLSPHAPYSLDTRVLADLARLAQESSLRLHTHLAESEFEDSYYRDGTGPLADFVAGFRPDFQILVEGGAALTSAEFAHQVGLLDADGHVAHGIYLDVDGRALLRATNTPVALCPRSNATIGLNPPPIAAYLTEGNGISIGTDSLASSPSLDLLEDVRLLRTLAQEQGYQEDDLCSRLLRAATLGGAAALGMDHGDQAVGSIEPGKRADLALFDIATTAAFAEESLVEDGAGKCMATVVGGEIRFENAAGVRHKM